MLSARPIQLHENPTRTPGRALKGRNNLQENAYQKGGGAFTVHHKTVGQKPTPKTPFQPQRLFKDSKPATTATRPLLDKTPFPNRTTTIAYTPAPRKATFLTPHPQGETHIQRPSSTRKHIRIPRSASKSFETPATSGNPWDVSDVSISMESGELTGEETEQEDFDEIEYMPPRPVEMPFEFGFDLPDYKVLGSTLRGLIHSYPVDDSFNSVVDIGYDDEAIKAPKWEIFVLAELADESPFARKPHARKPLARAITLTSSKVAPTTRTRALSAAPPRVAQVSSHSARSTGTAGRPPSVAATRNTILPSRSPSVAAKTTPAFGTKPQVSTSTTRPQLHSRALSSATVRAPSTRTTTTGSGVRSTAPATKITSSARPNASQPQARSDISDTRSGVGRRPATVSAMYNKASMINGKMVNKKEVDDNLIRSFGPVEDEDFRFDV